MCWVPLVKANRLLAGLCVLAFSAAGMLRGETVEVFQVLFEQQRALAERSLEEEVDSMAVKYDQSLEKLEGPIREMGDLTLLLALKDARKSFAEGLPTKQGPPLSEYPPFQRLQDTWLRLYAQWQLRRAVRLTELVDQYDRMLESQQVKATQTDRIEFALQIRAERERVQADEELTELRAMVDAAQNQTQPDQPVGPQLPILVALKANTVLFLNFDRDEGGRVTDRSPARNHGKVEQTEWIRQGRRGGAMRFAHDEARIEIANSESLQIAGDLTISFWMLPEEFGARRNPINKSFGGEYTMTLEEDGRINFYHGLAGENSDPYQGYTTTGKVKKGAWTHICLVRSSEEQTLKWYINGEVDKEGASKYKEVTPSGLGLTLGRGYAGPFRGLLDDVLILKTTLSDSQVRRLYQSLGGR